MNTARVQSVASLNTKNPTSQHNSPFRGLNIFNDPPSIVECSHHVDARQIGSVHTALWISLARFQSASPTAGRDQQSVIVKAFAFSHLNRFVTGIQASNLAVGPFQPQLIPMRQRHRPQLFIFESVGQVVG